MCLCVCVRACLHVYVRVCFVWVSYTAFEVYVRSFTRTICRSLITIANVGLLSTIGHIGRKIIGVRGITIKPLEESDWPSHPLTRRELADLQTAAAARDADLVARLMQIEMKVFICLLRYSAI